MSEIILHTGFAQTRSGEDTLIFYFTLSLRLLYFKILKSSKYLFFRSFAYYIKYYIHLRTYFVKKSKILAFWPNSAGLSVKFVII